MTRIALLLAVLAGQAHADHWIDLPAWPKPTPAAAHLRWIVTPRASESRPVTLEVEADGITRAVVLEPQAGDLRAGVTLGKGEVGALAFRDTGFVVKRSGDTLMVFSWERADGAKRHDTLVAKLHVPARMKLDEEIRVTKAP